MNSNVFEEAIQKMVNVRQRRLGMKCPAIDAARNIGNRRVFQGGGREEAKGKFY